jgi:hypothetical protein
LNGEVKKEAKEKLEAAQKQARTVQDDINKLNLAGVDTTSLETQHRALQQRITRLRGLFG